MKPKQSLSVILLLILLFSKAYGEPFTITPTGTSTPTVVPALSTPSPSPTAMVAPEWAPSKASLPTYQEPKKPEKSRWETLTGLGASIPLSSHFQRAYATGFSLDLGEGYQFTDLFSGWLMVNIEPFNSKNDALTGGENFNLIDAALLAKVNLTSSGVSPYLFAGPGVAYNETRSNTAVVYDDYGDYYLPISSYEVDLMAVGGAGIDLKAAEGFKVFLQGKVVVDLTSSGFAYSSASDSPLILIPIQIGVIFGI